MDLCDTIRVFVIKGAWAFSEGSIGLHSYVSDTDKSMGFGLLIHFFPNLELL